MGEKEKWADVLKKFILQSGTGNLKTSDYPKEWEGLKLKVSFGMGKPARIPWIAFITQEMQVSNGFYPVYLYYRDYNTLILAYGISETEEPEALWPAEIRNSAQTITAYFKPEEVQRYGNSFVFKAYKIEINGDNVNFLTDTGQNVTSEELESDLTELLNKYKDAVHQNSIGQSQFVMEKYLENFLINNWDKTELGKKYELIYDENGVLESQQYRTEVGLIDILAKDKKTGSFVVIELKKGKTSDDVVGQIARYIGWIKEEKKDENVEGIIITHTYDKNLEYALKIIPHVKVYQYEINFKLKEFTPPS